MTELIKISEHEGRKVISARDLHTFLESKKDFSAWIKHRVNKYGFIEDVDFVKLPQKGEFENQQVRIEYALTLEAGKELSMVEGNAKGKQARQYFIECERVALQPKALPSIKELAKMVIKAEEEKERITLQLEAANEIIKEQAPQVEYVNKVLSAKSTVHTSQIAQDFGMSAIALNKKLEAMGVQRKMDGGWILTAKYSGKGYTHYRHVPYMNSLNEQCTKVEMVWTEQGRLFLHILLKEEKAA